ncbi:sensor histidine kinase [Flexivirga sp.]|uniref:sensor histidine kinase n=1 Tax=Flexivirga sp. TaxID=1962927 RepID=UPI003F7D53E2
MRIVPKTLTSRLALLLAGLVLLGGAVAGLAGTIGIRAFLMSQLDSELHQAAARNVTLKAPGSNDRDSDNLSDNNAGLPPGTITGHISHGVMTDLVVAADLDGDHLPTRADRTAVQHVAGTDHPATAHLPTLGDYRVLTLHTRNGAELVTGVPQERVNHTIRELIVLEVAALAAAVVLVAAVGAFAVRRSMRPLQHLATVARRVTELPLESGQSRIPVRAEEMLEPTEVAQVGRAMNAMLGHVDLALQQRDESERRLRDFAADASHELRTPLAVARSHAELLREYMSSVALPPEVHRSLRRIGDETGRMSSIVNDLLLLARLDQARAAHPQDVDLTRLVLEAVDDARVAAPSHHWSMDVPERPVIVRGEEEQLRRLVSNLITNVRLHTPEGTAARCALQEDGGQVSLRVHDTGPGFPPELLDLAHLRFARSRHRQDSPDSTGLGLAIVHAVARSHDGGLDIASVPGDTTVTVTLPANAV